MLSEFELISQYFYPLVTHTDLAGGDDAALITVAAGHQLVVSTDMLVEEIHFFKNTDPWQLGWKSLAVNISDIAAMSALPRWATLALSLPCVDETWLSEFSAGFLACAHQYSVDLVGGDTTKGPTSITVTIMGEIPTNSAIKRSGAQDGDDLWITGYPGKAALGLADLQGKISLVAIDRNTYTEALQKPYPRVEAGLALRDIAHAMLDVSDGLMGDLKHIMASSKLGAILQLEQLPVNQLRSSGLDTEQILSFILKGGDDYELLFTASCNARQKIKQEMEALSLPCSRIGVLTAQHKGVLAKDKNGIIRNMDMIAGYEHF